jgi:hypothetical protein
VAFVLGLLAALPRKNCWTIAEHAGDVTPDGMLTHPVEWMTHSLVIAGHRGDVVRS